MDPDGVGNRLQHSWAASLPRVKPVGKPAPTRVAAVGMYGWNVRLEGLKVRLEGTVGRYGWNVRLEGTIGRYGCTVSPHAKNKLRERDIISFNRSKKDDVVDEQRDGTSE
jgi:hypothetical protein